MTIKKDYKKVKGFYRQEVKIETGFFKYINNLKNFLNEDYFHILSKDSMADAMYEVSEIVEGMDEETFYQAFMKDSELSERFGQEYFDMMGSEDFDEVYARIKNRNYEFENMKISIISENFDLELRGKKGYSWKGDKKVPADQIWNRIAVKTDEGMEKLGVYTEKLKEIGFRDIEELLTGDY